MQGGPSIEKITPLLNTEKVTKGGTKKGDGANDWWPLKMGVNADYHGGAGN